MAKGRLATEISWTPAMVAALYGSTTVLAYALYAAPREATQAPGTDITTALHLAAAGSAANAVSATQLLLAVSTEVLSMSGLLAGDLLQRAAEKPSRLLIKSPAVSPPYSLKKSAILVVPPLGMDKGQLAMEISRTPAVVAALYGSTTVLAYAHPPRLASHPGAGHGGSTALHLAAAGGATKAVAACTCC